MNTQARPSLVSGRTGCERRDGCGFNIRRVCVFRPSSKARIIGALKIIG
jgi:hypothetical protein